ncbi:MAG: hypothetical protein RLZZ535_505 [Cyanobacteriota bacterium]|jgi:hypothetical protein
MTQFLIFNLTSKNFNFFHQLIYFDAVLVILNNIAGFDNC